MFDVAPTELLLVALVALVVIGPKDLPKAMRFVGYWVGRARSVMRQFRSGFDSMVREAELEEMEKKWAAENARIMAEHPAPAMLPHVPDSAPIADHDHDDGEAPPVIVEQPGFAPDPTPPPPSSPPPVQSPPSVQPVPSAPAQVELALDANPPVTAAESGEGAPAPARKPRKPKAAS